jgi:hypothetical protein
MNHEWAVEEIINLSNGLFDQEQVTQMVSICYSLDINEMKEYLNGILGNSPQVSMFINQFVLKRQPRQVTGAWKIQPTLESVLNEIAGGIYSPQDQLEMINHAKTLTKSEADKYFGDLFGTGSEVKKLLQLIQKVVEKGNAVRLKEEKNLPFKSKRKQKRSLKAKENMVKIGNAPDGINGKPICECMATVHDLVTNCLSCGKIMCAFEEDANCLFCGSLMYDPDAKLDVSEQELAQIKADRLLEFDKNSAERTRVRDNAADYDVGADEYNRWATPEERGLAVKARSEKEAREEEARKQRVITIDLEKKIAFVEKPIQDLNVKKKKPVAKEEFTGGLPRNPHLTLKPLTYIPQNLNAKLKKKPHVVVTPLEKSRLQDDDDYFY